MERFAKVTDDKENLNYVRDTVNSSNSFGMRAMQVWFRYPFSGFAGNYILDHYMALSSFITINNKSVQEWNATMDDSSWDYSTMQLAGGTDPKGIYNRPIRMFVVTFCSFFGSRT